MARSGQWLSFNPRDKVGVRTSESSNSTKKERLDVILDQTRYYIRLFSSFEYFTCYNF